MLLAQPVTHICLNPEWRNSFTTIAGTYAVNGTSTTRLSRPYNVFIDSYDNTYVADTSNNRIIRFQSGKSLIWNRKLILTFCQGLTSGIVIAGSGIASESGNNVLNHPTGVFVTRNQTMFIIDSKNFRIQKWNNGESLGYTVAGGHGEGNSLDKISVSFGLYVDDEFNIYISEYENHRVTIWMNNNTTAGRIVSYIHDWLNT